jgi:8-oxo-dGTP pyrophosphatase MutT (NUDIX family)
VEEGETDEVALQRECKEEAGIEATIWIALWTIVEQGKTGEIIQENRGYIVNIVWKKGKNKLTDEELERKFELYRMDIDEAIVLIKKTSPSSYRWRFMQERDLTFLQEARKLIS